MAEIDDLLSSTLKRVAEPGDPTGVADAIRSRLAAGDTGTPSDSSEFGGTWWKNWLPWIGVVVVAGLVGGTLGAAGAFGRPAAEDAAEPFISIAETTAGLDCPGGAPVTTFSANDRVLAVARSEDNAYLAVRDTYDYSRTVWVPALSVVVDEGEDALDSLKVGGCPEPVVVVNTPTSTPEPTVEPEPEPEPGPGPGPGPGPQPTPDTERPVPGQWWASPTTIVCPSNVGSAFPGTTSLRLTATDNVGVTGVSISWSGAHSGSGSMSLVSGEWRYSFTMPAENSGPITFTMTPRDAAGNIGAPSSVVVQVHCLI